MQDYTNEFKENSEKDNKSNGVRAGQFQQDQINDIDHNDMLPLDPKGHPEHSWSSLTMGIVQIS